MKKVLTGLTGLLGLNAFFVSLALSDRINGAEHPALSLQLLTANLFLIGIGLTVAAIWMAVDL